MKDRGIKEGVPVSREEGRRKGGQGEGYRRESVCMCVKERYREIERRKERKRERRRVKEIERDQDMKLKESTPAERQMKCIAMCTTQRTDLIYPIVKDKKVGHFSTD